MRLSSTVWKSLVIVGGLVISFCIGGWYAAHQMQDAMKVGIFADIIQQDKVLSYMENGQMAEAKKTQREYLERSFSMVSGYSSDWPDEVKKIKDKRPADK
jgi:hypothetical protein